MSDTTVLCARCGVSKRVDFSYCLRTGWPKCCGVTMRIKKTDTDIEAATKLAILKQLPAKVRREFGGL